MLFPIFLNLGQVCCIFIVLQKPCLAVELPIGLFGAGNYVFWAVGATEKCWHDIRRNISLASGLIRRVNSTATKSRVTM